MHQTTSGLVESCALGAIPELPAADPEHDAALSRGRAMIDVSLAGSALIGDWLGTGLSSPDGPPPGERYPDRIRLTGLEHHLILFGDTAPPPGFEARWAGLVSLLDGDAEGLSPTRAGVSGGGAVLVRPDGHLGFRAVPADAGGLAAIDAHLESYLVPAGSRVTSSR